MGILYAISKKERIKKAKALLRYHKSMVKHLEQYLNKAKLDKDKVNPDPQAT